MSAVLAQQVKVSLAAAGSTERANKTRRYFKSGPGEYAEGDQFLGVTMPQQRVIAGTFSALPLSEARLLLVDPAHECRLTALLILVRRFQRADAAGRREVLELYLANLDHVNNWDLVDTSAPAIVGGHLLSLSDRSLLDTLAATGHLWRQRVAMIATHTLRVRPQTVQQDRKQMIALASSMKAR